jgi:hypothetical protein
MTILNVKVVIVTSSHKGPEILLKMKGDIGSLLHMTVHCASLIPENAVVKEKRFKEVLATEKKPIFLKHPEM